MIEVAGLRCVYGEHVAVDGIDFSVQPGEVFALLGANGAGKTTTLEALEGHRAPSAGTVRVLGHDPLRERRAVRPRTGIMLQEGGFAGELTVRETASLWARLSSRRGERRRRPRAAGPRPSSRRARRAALRRRAAASGGRARDPRLTRVAAARRADDRPGPGVAPAHVAGDRRAGGGGDDDPADDALPSRRRRRSRTAWRSCATAVWRSAGRSARSRRAWPSRISSRAPPVPLPPTWPPCASPAGSTSTCSRRPRCRPTSGGCWAWADAQELATGAAARARRLA